MTRGLLRAVHLQGSSLPNLPSCPHHLPLERGSHTTAPWWVPRVASQVAPKEENVLWDGVGYQELFHKEGAFEVELKEWVGGYFHRALSQDPFYAGPSKKG